MACPLFVMFAVGRFHCIFFIIRHYFQYCRYICSISIISHQFNQAKRSHRAKSFSIFIFQSLKYFSICHSNLNSITFHDFLKANFLAVCNVKHKFELFVSLNLPQLRYLVQPCNLNILGNRRGEVYIYYKESLRNN